ncbi:hypothetical protein [Clavibacter michiganensis]|uniref:hypothetical protein n=1 Tax=Clavibacter michiganensis TaxID=28447 RepID=UPI0011D1CB48|nr:hypothetical protein [Clavibacter michiganensis]
MDQITETPPIEGSAPVNLDYSALHLRLVTKAEYLWEIQTHTSPTSRAVSIETVEIRRVKNAFEVFKCWPKGETDTYRYSSWVDAVRHFYPDVTFA